MKRIKIAQIGVCHEHAAAKMDTIRGMPDVFEVVGIVDDRNSKAAKRAGSDMKPYEGLKIMTEEEIFRYPGLEAVFVETPNADLVPTALRCMEHDLPMHMDKPGGEDLMLFKKLIDGCKSKKLPFQMGYMFRNNPAIEWCMKAVREKRLGEIFEVQASMSHNYGGSEYQEYLGNFMGGIMFNLGCHIIDFTAAMLGRPERIKSFLKSTHGVSEKIKNNCMLVMEYPHALATLRACSMEVDGINNRFLKICGSDATVEIKPIERFDGSPLKLNLRLRKASGEYSPGEHIIDFGVQTDRYRDQLTEFASIVRGEMENPYTYEHDYLVQEIVSASSGCCKWRN